MKAKSIRQTTRRIESGLAWQIVNTMHDAPLDIISDPITRTHTIRFPKNPNPDDPVREIEYLHELAHAVLAEQDPAFCVYDIIYEENINESLIPIVSNVVRSTVDWFTDDLLSQWCPNEFAGYIREHVDLMRRGLVRDPNPPDDLTLAMGHIFAQGVRYLKIRIPNLPQPVKLIMDKFLAVNPRKPSEYSFSILFNSLLADVNLSATRTPSESAWLLTRI